MANLHIIRRSVCCIGSWNFNYSVKSFARVSGLVENGFLSAIADYGFAKIGPNWSVERERRLDLVGLAGSCGPYDLYGAVDRGRDWRSLCDAPNGNIVEKQTGCVGGHE